MAELAEVETPKNAGFVQAKPKRKRVPKRKRPIQKLKKKRYLQKRDRLRNDIVIYAAI